MSDASDFYDRLNDTLKEPDKCYLCEDAPAEETHHIVPQRFEGSDAKSNVVDLCHDCHWKLERLYNKDFYNVLGIEDPRQTNEKHVVCRIHGCTEQATQTDTYGYVCDDHENGVERSDTSDASEFASVGGDTDE